MKISVIIPALDEAERLPETLEHLAHCKDVQIVLVDGGSRDGTPEIARRFTPLVFESIAGRGIQMNVGAQHASGEILLFLHVDSRIPAAGLDALRREMQAPGVVGGAFRLRIEPPGRRVNLISAGANLRSRWLRLPFGDQGIFLRASLFHDLGGFPEIPLMEDVAFVLRLRRTGKLVILPVAITTSSRRWDQEGVCLGTLRNWTLLLLYLAGVSPRHLTRW